MSAGAVCNNMTVKGVYDVKLTNADGSVITGGMSFDGLSNINFYGSTSNYGSYTTTLYKNGVRFTGKGAYNFDSKCKLSGIGHYVYNGITTQTIMYTNAMTIVSSHATYGTGKFNAANMTLKAR